MPDRFFVEQPIGSQGRVQLTGDEAQHLAKVLRAAPGDSLVLFDGSGQEFQAQVAKVGKSSVDVEVLERRAVDRELPGRFVAVVALPKGDRQKWLVEKLVELGCHELVPLETRRGVAQPVDSALARLERHVIEASKQCGRNVLMKIGPPTSLAAATKASLGVDALAIAHPYGEQSRRLSSELFADRTAIAIGPEGGFADEEIAVAIDAGWTPVTLGPTIVRVETAAITALAVWRARRG